MKHLEHIHVGGVWRPASDSASYEAINPATGEPIGRVASGTPQDIDDAVRAARRAQPELARMSIWERSALLLRIAERMDARRKELAEILSLEQGKPLAREAVPEIAKATQGFREAAEHIKWMEGATIPVADPNKRVMTYRYPRGVYGIITPWNFPINIPVEYLAPGLAAGNAIVWVPAPTTSLCALVLVDCMIEAGLPDGAINIVTGMGPVVGDALAAHPAIDGIGFTGSTATGHSIAGRAAGKAQLMELGGNGPVIVLDDADLDRAATAICTGSFVNAGQICSASERILVQRKVLAPLTERIVAIARGVRLGDPADPETTMGPLNNHNVRNKVERQIRESVGGGASILCGGASRPDLGGDLYFEPTVITNVSRSCSLACEESFGPVVPLIACDGIEDISAAALDDNLGLAAAVFTNDLRRAHYFADLLPVGLVNINERSTYWELHLPFGGGAGRASGIGRIGGRHALDAMSVLKTVSIDVGRGSGDVGWPEHWS